MGTQVAPEHLSAITATRRLARQAALKDRAKKGHVGLLGWCLIVAAVVQGGSAYGLLNTGNGSAAIAIGLAMNACLCLVVAERLFVASRLDAIVELLIQDDGPRP